MNIQQAVKDTLAADPAIVRIEPRAELQIGQIAPISDKPVTMADAIVGAFVAKVSEPPVAHTALCRCCTVATAIRDGRCYACAIEHEAEAKRLKELLARCLPIVISTHLEIAGSVNWHSDLRELIRDIEAELGGDDD